MKFQVEGSSSVEVTRCNGFLIPSVVAIERQDVHIAGNRSNRVSFAPGMDAEGCTTDAAATNSVFLLASADLHVVTTDTRCYDQSSILAGIHIFLMRRVKSRNFLSLFQTIVRCHPLSFRLGNLGRERREGLVV